MRHTVRGTPPTNPDDAPVPTDEKLPDGQHKDHWVLSPEERAKGFIRPVRRSYKHVGIAGPKYPLRDLTDGEKDRLGKIYAKYEEFPKSEEPRIGRFWTQKELDSINMGCGTITTMPVPIAETYAREPRYYGSTFCCGCGLYLRVGERGEFVWEGTDERVGT